MTAASRARQGYGPANAKAGRSARQIEYDAFAQVSAALGRASTEEAGSGDLVRAVHGNKELWTTLAAAVADDGNALPAETRAGIISLAAYVERRGRALLADGGDLSDLIDLNRTIMAGLSAGGAA